jgi:proteic killer suppression protein
MLLRHADRKLQRLEEDPSYQAGLAENIVTAFRRRLQAIRAAVNENDLRALKSLHFEKLKGDRKDEYSMRINDQFRLVFTIEKGKHGNTLVILGIEDYH